MVYNAQNYWVCVLCPSSDILETKNHDISETGSVFSPSAEDGNISSFRNVVFSSF
jgi:hypothetical protein